jgi:hypothetical protein
LLGCIADDFTGATDLANMLVRGGMRTVQTIGVPAEMPAVAADALVIALKSRTIPAAEAIAQSLAALRWLQQQGCTQFFFKYCSTFDSTDEGNIGPVTDALMKELGEDFTIACPAFPENGRTIYRGYLFVADALLNESGMENHPLTPMTDANLVRVLQRQTESKVGLVRYDTVARGAAATQERFTALRPRASRWPSPMPSPTRTHPGRSLRRTEADHRWFRRGPGPARELPPRRPAACRRRSRATAQGRWPVGGAGRFRLQGDQCAGGRMESQASRLPHRPAGPGPWRRRGGPGAGLCR